MEVVLDKGIFTITHENKEIKLTEKEAEKLSFEIEQKIRAKQPL